MYAVLYFCGRPRIINWSIHTKLFPDNSKCNEYCWFVKQFSKHVIVVVIHEYHVFAVVGNKSHEQTSFSQYNAVFTVFWVGELGQYVVGVTWKPNSSINWAMVVVITNDNDNEVDMVLEVVSDLIDFLLLVVLDKTNGVDEVFVIFFSRWAKKEPKRCLHVIKHFIIRISIELIIVGVEEYQNVRNSNHVGGISNLPPEDLYFVQWINAPINMFNI